MAVAQTQGSPTSTGRRVAVGTNVALAIVLVFGIVGVVQAMAYRWPIRTDMTGSGVNSLSDGTKKLLEGLEQNVRVTSLYFETDREEEDQSRYRQAAQNLIDLYEATNRGKVKAEWVNPLKDHERFQKLTNRLRELPSLNEGVAKYQERLDAYKNELDGKLRAMLSEELEKAASGGGGMGGGSSNGPVARIELTLRQLEGGLEDSRKQVDALTSPANPQLAAAVGELRTLYPQLSKALKDIAKFASEVSRQTAGLSAAETQFLQGASGRYAEVVADLEGETTKLQDLPQPKIDDVLSQIVPTANAILVETDKDARVVDFGSMWPPIDERSGPRASLERRAFKGEEKMTAAILRATHREQTAVVFVRYGGQPLFFGGFMPGQPQAAYSMMKQQLEDANFAVEEWDLKANVDKPPTIEPKPTRTIYVLLKPEPPQQGPMGQPSQEPPFGPNQRDAILKAIGDNGRALFIAGWAPGPFGPIPSEYEYNAYLKDKWGVHVDTSALLIEAQSIAPGKFMASREAFDMVKLDATDHPIVASAQARQLRFPFSAPLELAKDAPDGVQQQTLLALPGREGLWGVKDITKYQQQLEQRDYLTKEAGDLDGPFTLAVAASKGDAKIVVVSSRAFATDAVAFARGLAMTSQGVTIRTLNPGNVTLTVNALHWLNDKVEFMDIGRPIESSVLEIASPTTVKAVQAFTIFVWPAVALACGGAAWWVRRR